MLTLTGATFCLSLSLRSGEKVEHFVKDGERFREVKEREVRYIITRHNTQLKDYTVKGINYQLKTKDSKK